MQRLLLSLSLATSTLARAETPRPPRERDARFVNAIRNAAESYQRWGRVDERPNLAPALCAAVAAVAAVPSHVRLSQAEDGPHADKLYYLWASDRGSYLALAGEHAKDPPVGLALVKQSFTAKPLATRPEASAVSESGSVPAPVTWLEHDGKLLAIDRPKDLFVMIKVASGAEPGTDDGWIYGTVAPDGSVTSAGRVERCMGCHDDAAHGRLFGPRKD
ncbi:MAG: hypothetical protein ACM31C_16305 [Acidobacteriota bacterium]